MVLRSASFLRSCVWALSSPPRGVPLLGKPAQGLPQPVARLVGVRIVTVGVARPEETAQPVFAPSRDDVHVQVRNALADPVVDRDEGAFRTEALLHRAREQPSVRD